MSALLARLVLGLLLVAALLGPSVRATATQEEQPPQELEEFVPTEEVGADHAVAFPVDI